jgi:hypothetical protein
MPNIRRAAVLIVLPLAALGACGGDDDDTTDEVPPAAVDETTPSQNVSEPADSEPIGADSDPVAEPAPAEPSGTVRVGGLSYDLTAADLLLCETVNPAFDESINIQAKFDVDPDTIVIHGTTISSRMSLSVLGDLPDGISVEAGDADMFGHPAQVVEVDRDGRTVSGTATVIDERVGASVTDDNPLQDATVEFSFTC